MTRTTLTHWPELATTPRWQRSRQHALAELLLAASAALAQMAARLGWRPGRRQPQVLEFYAEAGAPEGALYVDGDLVGYLPGVTRL